MNFFALRDEWYCKLARAGFRDIEAGLSDGYVGRRVRGSDPHRAAYYDQAGAFLAEYACSAEARRVLELHVGGASKDAILRALDGDTGRRPSGAARRRVKRIVDRFKAALRGEERRGPGRPRKDDGLGGGCYVLPGLRLDDYLTEGLMTMAERLGVTPYQAARLAIKAQVRDYFGISARGK